MWPASHGGDTRSEQDLIELVRPDDVSAKPFGGMSPLDGTLEVLVGPRESLVGERDTVRPAEAGSGEQLRPATTALLRALSRRGGCCPEGGRVAVSRPHRLSMASGDVTPSYVPGSG